MDIKEDYTKITTKQVNEIAIKIELFLLILVKDKLLYYDNSIFEVIKFLNELKTFDINKFKYIEICKIIYHTHFLTNLYDDDIYKLVNVDNAEQLFNYIVYCNNNNIINNRIIKLVEIFINSNKKELLRDIGYYYFNYANIICTNYNINNSYLFDKIIFFPKVEFIKEISAFNNNIIFLISKYHKKSIPSYSYELLTKICPTICSASSKKYNVLFNSTDKKKYLSYNYNKYIIIEKLINHEPNTANILPLVTNDILHHLNNDIPILIMSEKNINKNDYNKKFDNFDFNDIYNEFIIKKTTINYRLYTALLYIFYDKYILNYKSNTIFINTWFLYDTYYYCIVYRSLSYIYLSNYWNFIEKKILQENILNTIEYEELYNIIQNIYTKNDNIKKYFIENNLLTSCIYDHNNFKTHYANCLYIQLKSNANIPFIYAYLPKVNFGLNV